MNKKRHSLYRVQYVNPCRVKEALSPAKKHAWLCMKNKNSSGSLFDLTAVAAGKNKSLAVQSKLLHAK